MRTFRGMCLAHSQHHMTLLPKPRTSPDRTPFRIDGPARVAVLNDIHCPYHDPGALEICLAYFDKRQPTHILLNGDTVDAEAVASWDKDPTKKAFHDEIADCNQLLDHVRERFPKSIIVFKHGNHENRLQTYIWRKAPELAGLFSLQLRTLLRFDDRKIVEVPSYTKSKLGKLVVIHGHEYRFSISNPVNPARGIFLRMHVSAMCGHFHQFSSHSQRNGDDRLITTWSMGALCHLSPDYAPLNNWSHGFAEVEVEADGSFGVQNLRILHGRVWTS
jgi:predicted phosphodiesterase